MEINNIRLLVNNFEECFEFYKDQLGLKVSYGDIESPYASFETGELSQIAIFKSEMMATTVGTTDLADAENVRDKFVIVVEVDSVDKEFKRLSENGVEFVNEPTDMQAWGIRVAHLRDPENNLIELFSELSGNGAG